MSIDWSSQVTSIPGYSFCYSGSFSTDFLPAWAYTQIQAPTTGGVSEQHTWLEPQPNAAGSQLQVSLHCRRWDQFQAVEWMLEFENLGRQVSPLIEAILPLDASLPVPGNERLRLHHANGSDCHKDDFLPHLSELPPHSHKTLAPVGGRSSNGVLPFFNLQHQDGGAILAIGWSGQWSARFERTSAQVILQAGMERTHLRLEPGEKIRSPRILLLPWQGNDPDTGQNQLRQLLLERYLPRLDGELIQPPVAQCLQAYYYLTGKAGEAYEMTALPKCAALGVEVYWIDACWYGGQKDWWQEVGSWEVNLERFPHGLRPISDAARQAGMKFLLWFEPERARPGSQLAVEHPEFFLHSPANPDNLLFNLGNPAAREYLTELLSQRIQELGVDIYRQDFNFDPLEYWKAADASERAGMAEIRYVEGLYRMWDELRQRHPGLWIDNCSSGGRRIDIETLQRSLPLWPSDFCDVVGLPYGLTLHTGDQCINAGLARWVPFFGGGVWDFTPYGTRSQIIGGFTFGYHIEPADFPAADEPSLVSHQDVLARGKTLLDPDFPLEQARLAIEEWQSIRPYFTGNFHLLLPLTADDHDWCAWQFHRADLGAGIALAFRRHLSPFPGMETRLKEIEPQAMYRVSLSPGYTPGPYKTMSGKELAQITLAIPQQPGSVLLRYQKT